MYKYRAKTTEKNRALLDKNFLQVLSIYIINRNKIQVRSLGKMTCIE